ncbi:DUF3168 domain-containing protein [Allomesorhizobium camelthorni]|uniref:DUF3168 domain-containing protein n=1 Tax=Allomesorhizobium camelthorni TaxID=475069 RepID=A0A6G4WA07_9HYPH|nr:DUF3168 domain-containing protein [Mesorhizobium camelthorni]NGO51612.1 DUF3168 domain-containing protein [Mesorhizobium camelthorni]
MTSPAKELQGAIVSRLKADATVAALVEQRIYDHVPRSTTGDVSATFPFVGIANWQEISDDADCINGFQIFVDIDCWSRSVGFPQVHDLADAVRAALSDAEFALSANALVYFECRENRTFRDPDGLSSHAVLTFEAFVEQP